MKIATLILIVAGTLSGLYLGGQIFGTETPNERVERIDRMANYECNKYEGLQAQDCFSWYYSQVEDRN